jgi:L-lactate dehydrogenase (cytochrome)
MPVITEIEDLKRIYKRRVPKMFYDYAESGSWTEQTFRENSSDFDEIRLRQRIAVDMDGRSTAAKMVGQDYAMPVALAPVGLCGMQSADGEIKAARAAEKFGVPFTLSTMSICSIEDVASHTKNPSGSRSTRCKDDDFMKRLFARAKDAKCSALVITVDLQIMGQRHKDIKNGLSAPPKLTPASIQPGDEMPWGLEMLQTKRRFFGKSWAMRGRVRSRLAGLLDGGGLRPVAGLGADQGIPQLVGRPGDPQGRPGRGRREDGRNVGADAIVVSNHGGRQLDGALSSIRMLPRIMDAVGDKIEVHLDSGIRSGQDVLKALALGAKGTMIGRAFVYGLGAMGQAGVTKALEVIHKELDTTMALCGERDVADLGRHNLLLPPGFEDATGRGPRRGRP